MISRGSWRVSWSSTNLSCSPRGSRMPIFQPHAHSTLRYHRSAQKPISAEACRRSTKQSRSLDSSHGRIIQSISLKSSTQLMPTIEIAGRTIGDANPTYFIADIAANHDGDLERAVALVHRAAEAGADAAKFQHFRAAKIVSKFGFETGPQLSHQSKWKRSVFEVYQSASVPWEWTERLKKACDEARIHFFSSPYDMEAVDMLDKYVPAFKIGSGDITWIEALEHMARKGKPVLLATGASDLGDVQRAVDAILAINQQLLLMQCNTNYTGSIENFRYVRL